MVVSLNKGTPIKTPIYYSPYYRDPQKGTPNFGKLPYHAVQGAGLRIENLECRVEYNRNATLGLRV